MGLDDISFGQPVGIVEAETSADLPDTDTQDNADISMDQPEMDTQTFTDDPVNQTDPNIQDYAEEPFTDNSADMEPTGTADAGFDDPSRISDTESANANTRMETGTADNANSQTAVDETIQEVQPDPVSQATVNETAAEPPENTDAEDTVTEDATEENTTAEETVPDHPDTADTADSQTAAEETVAESENVSEPVSGDTEGDKEENTEGSAETDAKTDHNSDDPDPVKTNGFEGINKLCDRLDSYKDEFAENDPDLNKDIFDHNLLPDLASLKEMIGNVGDSINTISSIYLSVHALNNDPISEENMQTALQGLFTSSGDGNTSIMDVAAKEIDTVIADLKQTPIVNNDSSIFRDQIMGKVTELTGNIRQIEEGTGFPNSDAWGKIISESTDAVNSRFESMPESVRPEFSLKDNGAFTDQYGITMDGHFASKVDPTDGGVDKAVEGVGAFIDALNETYKDTPDYTGITSNEKALIQDAVRIYNSVPDEERTEKPPDETEQGLEKYSAAVIDISGVTIADKETIADRLEAAYDRVEEEKEKADRADSPGSNRFADPAVWENKANDPNFLSYYSVLCGTDAGKYTDFADFLSGYFHISENGDITDRISSRFDTDKSADGLGEYIDIYNRFCEKYAEINPSEAQVVSPVSKEDKQLIIDSFKKINAVSDDSSQKPELTQDEKFALRSFGFSVSGISYLASSGKIEIPQASYIARNPYGGRDWGKAVSSGELKETFAEVDERNFGLYCKLLDGFFGIVPIDGFSHKIGPNIDLANAKQGLLDYIDTYNKLNKQFNLNSTAAGNIRPINSNDKAAIVTVFERYNTCKNPEDFKMSSAEKNAVDRLAISIHDAFEIVHDDRLQDIESAPRGQWAVTGDDRVDKFINRRNQAMRADSNGVFPTYRYDFRYTYNEMRAVIGAYMHDTKINGKSPTLADCFIAFHNWSSTNLIDYLFLDLLGGFGIYEDTDNDRDRIEDRGGDGKTTGDDDGKSGKSDVTGEPFAGTIDDDTPLRKEPSGGSGFVDNGDKNGDSKEKPSSGQDGPVDKSGKGDETDKKDPDAKDKPDGAENRDDADKDQNADKDAFIEGAEEHPDSADTPDEEKSADTDKPEEDKDKETSDKEEDKDKDGADRDEEDKDSDDADKDDEDKDSDDSADKDEEDKDSDNTDRDEEDDSDAADKEEEEEDPDSADDEDDEDPDSTDKEEEDPDSADKEEEEDPDSTDKEEDPDDKEDDKDSDTADKDDEDKTDDDTDGSDKEEDPDDAEKQEDLDNPEEDPDDDADSDDADKSDEDEDKDDTDQAEEDESPDDADGEKEDEEPDDTEKGEEDEEPDDADGTKEDEEPDDATQPEEDDNPDDAADESDDVEKPEEDEEPDDAADEPEEDENPDDTDAPEDEKDPDDVTSPENDNPDDATQPEEDEEPDDTDAGDEDEEPDDTDSEEEDDNPDDTDASKEDGSSDDADEGEEDQNSDNAADAPEKDNPDDTADEPEEGSSDDVSAPEGDPVTAQDGADKEEKDAPDIQAVDPGELEEPDRKDDEDKDAFAAEDASAAPAPDIAAEDMAAPDTSEPENPDVTSDVLPEDQVNPDDAATEPKDGNDPDASVTEPEDEEETDSPADEPESLVAPEGVAVPEAENADQGGGESPDGTGEAVESPDTGSEEPSDSPDSDLSSGFAQGLEAPEMSSTVKPETDSSDRSEGDQAEPVILEQAGDNNNNEETDSGFIPDNAAGTESAFVSGMDLDQPNPSEQQEPADVSDGETVSGTDEPTEPFEPEDFDLNAPADTDAEGTESLTPFLTDAMNEYVGDDRFGYEDFMRYPVDGAEEGSSATLGDALTEGDIPVQEVANAVADTIVRYSDAINSSQDVTDVIGCLINNLSDIVGGDHFGEMVNDAATQMTPDGSEFDVQTALSSVFESAADQRTELPSSDVDLDYDPFEVDALTDSILSNVTGMIGDEMGQLTAEHPEVMNDAGVGADNQIAAQDLEGYTQPDTGMDTGFGAMETQDLPFDQNLSDMETPGMTDTDIGLGMGGMNDLQYSEDFNSGLPDSTGTDFDGLDQTASDDWLQQQTMQDNMDPNLNDQDTLNNGLSVDPYVNDLDNYGNGGLSDFYDYGFGMDDLDDGL